MQGNLFMPVIKNLLIILVAKRYVHALVVEFLLGAQPMLWYISPFCSQHSIVLEMNVATQVDKMSMHRIDLFLFTILASLKTATGLIATVLPLN